MSLKSFHMVFIGCSAILAVMIGMWLLDGSVAAAAAQGSSRTLAAVGAFAVAAALVGYEVWFLRYLRRRAT